MGSRQGEFKCALEDNTPKKLLCSRDFQGAIVALLYVGPELGSLLCKKHKALLSHVTRLWGKNVDFAGLKLKEIHLLMLSTLFFFFSFYTRGFSS